MKIFLESRAILMVLMVMEVFSVKEDKAYWNSLAQETLSAALRNKPNTNIAKNVLFFLGDGMGVSTVTAARIFKGQQNGNPGEESKLSFEEFPNVALSKTYNVDFQVADSAGTATAFLAGVKTNFGLIGVDARGVRKDCTTQAGNEITSILKWSQEKGKSVGIVTTARITHATPSAAYAHSVERNYEGDDKIPEADIGICEDIASQLITKNSDINVILGGGRQFFLPNTTADPEYAQMTGKRLDGRNLIQEWIEKKQREGANYQYVWNITSFDKVNPSTTDYLFGLFEPSHMQYEIYRADDRAGEPSLTEMTEKAIQILSKNPNGYFLLIEGGRIDHAHHDSVAKRALSETVELSNAVSHARELTNQEDSLVVVTADHSHVFTIGGYPSRGNPILGLRGNKDIQPAFDNMPVLTLAYANGPGAGRANLTGNNTEAPDFVQQSLVPMKYETHGGEDVAIYAIGPMSHLFHGVQEQSYIAHVMAYASCVGANQEHCYNKMMKGSATKSSCYIWTTVGSVLLYMYIIAFLTLSDSMHIKY